MSIIADHLTGLEILDVIGQRIRQRRLERNLTVDALAAHAGLNRKTILALEAGEDIRLSSAIKILRSMNMLGLLESAIPDTLPGGSALSATGQRRMRATAQRRKAHHE